MSEGAGAKSRIRTVEFRRVKGVQSFQPELGFDALFDRYGLEEGEIPVGHSWPEHGNVASQVAEGKLRGGGEGSGVDVVAQPLLKASAGYGRNPRGIRPLAGVPKGAVVIYSLADSDGEAGAVHRDSIQLPAAHHVVERAALIEQ